MNRKANLLLFAAVAGASVIGFSSHKAYSQTTLFTTKGDWANFVNDGGGDVVKQSNLDVDGSTTNGAGSSTSPGGSGAVGSLEITADQSNSFAVAQSTGNDFIDSNQAFMSALDPGSVAAYTPATSFGPGSTVAYAGLATWYYTVPDNNASSNPYFEIQFDLAYDSDGFFGGGGGGDTIAPDSGNVVDGVAGSTTLVTTNWNGTGQSLIFASAPYQINAGSLSGMDLVVVGNTDYSPNNPFFIDDLQVQALPEPASLSLLGVGGLALLRRRRAAR